MATAIIWEHWKTDCNELLIYKVKQFSVVQNLKMEDVLVFKLPYCRDFYITGYNLFAVTAFELYIFDIQ